MILDESSGSAALPQPSSERWQILRAGIQNVWEYDDQCFNFHRGRLLLRGANESGKTKALEVLLPFLLDADLSPQRLDPFGSDSRPMFWNLLNDNNSDVEMTVGYVWIEFGRKHADAVEFCTLGAGLQAKRSGSQKVDAWYFITKLRVASDLRLVDERRIPLTQHQLEEKLAESGHVFGKGRAGEYRRKLNERLFGMPDEQYKTLIEALLQLRRPKLSERLDAKELSKILGNSLPALETRVIGPLAEGFERLDRHRVDREEYIGTLAAVREFLKVYREYVAIVAKGRAQQVTHADSVFQNARAAQKERRIAHDGAKKAQVELADRIAQLEGEKTSAEEQLRTLWASEAYKEIQKLEDAEREASESALRAGRASKRREDERHSLEGAERKREAAEVSFDHQKKVVDAGLRDAAKHAREAALDREHGAVAALIENGEETAGRATVVSLVAQRTKQIAELATHVEQARSAKDAADRAAIRLVEAVDRMRGAESHLSEAEKAQDDVEAGFREAVTTWIRALEILAINSDEETSLIEAEIEAMRPMAELLTDAQRTRMDDEVARVGRDRDGVVTKIQVLEARRQALVATTHQPPAAPVWRAPRPGEREGAPFYLLCDFKETCQIDRGLIEAALESSGVLDAWVTPDGVLLDPKTNDIVLRPEPRGGQTLSEVLVPIEAGGVERAVIEGVLSSVGLVADVDPNDSGCWIAEDGRWGLGPLRGAWHKPRPTYIGTTAREHERARLLSELEVELAALELQRAELDTALAGLRHRRKRLQEELAAFPDLAIVLKARADVSAAAKQLSVERQAHELATGASAKADRDLADAVAKRDARAVALGLLTWIDDLADLRERTGGYQIAAMALLQEARELTTRRDALSERIEAVEVALRRCADADDEAKKFAENALRTRAHAQTLLSAQGATRTELLAAIEETRGTVSSLERTLAASRTEKSIADTKVGETEGQLATAQTDVSAADDERREAEATFKAFAARGLLAVLEMNVEGEPEHWTFTDTLLLARGVDSKTDRADSRPDARDAADTRVAQKQQDLSRGLRTEIRLIAERNDGVLEYRVTFNGHSRSLLELVGDLEAEVATRDKLLNGEEQVLFESFLTGETKEHLSDRLRQAHALVERMKRELAKRPTGSGMVLGLAWEVNTENAPAGVAEAIDLLRRAGRLFSANDRAALKAFLTSRLAEAHAEEGTGTFEERMLRVLDYRRWFSFAVLIKPPGKKEFKPLTRKEHGAGSGGQKGLMLYYPLCAAAAAFYDSARPGAPRLIMLDEAFSGISPDNRGKLMGLLSEFDLDFVMTSFEEWGFYEELDGLSTYHLSREQGVRGIYTDWFVWDGKQATQMNT